MERARNSLGALEAWSLGGVRVKIHRLDPAVPVPSYQTAGAAGFDLASSVDMVVQPGAVALVPTGLVIEVPAGHFLAVFARSSTPIKRGLIVANGVGVVDSDYCGPEDEIKIVMWNFRSEAAQIRRGDRLAQGMILPFVQIEWDEAEGPTRKTRGGFGSTSS